MKSKVGLWIDHREAIVVTLSEPGEAVKRIVSGVEKHPERSSSAEKPGAFEALKVKADDLQQNALTGHLHSYYDAVIADLHGADAILILGPGVAKLELKKRIEEKKGGSVVVEPADKMTEHQIVAKVREHFKE